MGLTPNQVRLNSIKKISRDFELDRHELFRQVHGFDVLNQKVFNQYLETIDGINKQLVVERFYQRDVMTMVQDINRFGTGEVDLPITNADVHRHLEFLALCLGITNLTTSALWTLDLPSLDISAETETSLAAYRESQAIRQGRRQEHTREQERDAKRRKFIEMEEIEINEDDIVTWLQELPDDVSDGGPTQVRYEPTPSHHQVVAPHTPEAPDINASDPTDNFFLQSMLQICTRMETSVTRMAGLFDVGFSEVKDKLDTILSAQTTRRQSSGGETINDDTCNVGTGNSTNSLNLYLSSIEEWIRQTVSNL